MHDTTALTRARIERFRTERIAPALYAERHPLDLGAWAVPDEPEPFAVAHDQEFAPIAPGTPWGRPWGTTWFHLTGTVPAEWADRLRPTDRIEVVVDLGFSRENPGFQAEGAAYAPDGRLIKSVHPRNRHVTTAAGPGDGIDLYLESASNPSISSDYGFGPITTGDKTTAGTDPVYVLGRVDVAVLDTLVWELAHDVEVLAELLDQLPADSTRGATILRALDRMVDAVDPDDVRGTAAAGREALAGVLASPAHASAHRTRAVGHAHIDSAWLWPVRETHRKVARTFSNVLDLMDTDPDFVFAASSAQQYAWVKEDHPRLFERIKARVAEGRFIPVGGMWVESDTNMPGSEAMARQFVAGQSFFAREFGLVCDGVWLPDSFGYSAALPQLMRSAGADWFLTQKISWNETNEMPHHTFDWEGIDGSRVLTHFPPADTYNGMITGEELARTERKYAEKGAATTSMTLFGYGDGGGGPTREMLAKIARTHDLEGSPRVELGGPSEFFADAAAEYPHRPVWTGEMYLELHRGTYTSQARTKRGNRRSEHLLREAELWAATAAVRTGADYPYDELAEIWHTVLLQQFHDILPGTCIAWVYRVAEENYARIERELTTMIEAAATGLAGEGSTPLRFNAGPFTGAGVAALGAGEAATATSTTVVRREGDSTVLSNDRVRAVVDGRGVLVSVRDLATDREVVPAGEAAGVLQLFRDTPNQWDAWDVDEVYRRSAKDLTEPESVEVVETETGPGVRVTHRTGTSTIAVDYGLAADAPAVELRVEVDWHERQKMLKLAFPVDVHTDSDLSEVQFGHVRRATHVNTSWDAARFETCGHRWVHVAEAGYGVTIANDSTYGHDTVRHAKPDGGTWSTVRLSLLRAALFPDPEADQGHHVMRASLRVGASVADAVAEGYRMNLPARVVEGAAPVAPLVTVDDPAVVVEAVKLAEDRSGDVVVRLYESLGGRARATVAPGFEATSVVATDLLERTIDLDGFAAAAGTATVSLRPFEVVTLRFAR